MREAIWHHLAADQQDALVAVHDLRQAALHHDHAPAVVGAVPMITLDWDRSRTRNRRAAHAVERERFDHDVFLVVR